MNFDKYLNRDKFPEGKDYKDLDDLKWDVAQYRQKTDRLLQQFKEDLLIEFGEENNPRAAELFDLLNDKYALSREEKIYEEFKRLVGVVE